MIISVEELRKHITTDKEDSVLEEMLQALELLIRKYTNNNFQNRNIRYIADVAGDMVHCQATYFSEGDTIQISESELNNGIYTVASIVEGADSLVIDGKLYEESGVLVTKVVYPIDVKMGVVNLLKWEIENRGKVGIASETLSRHSVTYFNMDGDNSIMGYPKSLLGFLKPYKKARF